MHAQGHSRGRTEIPMHARADREHQHKHENRRPPNETNNARRGDREGALVHGPKHLDLPWVLLHVVAVGQAQHAAGAALLSHSAPRWTQARGAHAQRASHLAGLRGHHECEAQPCALRKKAAHGRKLAGMLVVRTPPWPCHRKQTWPTNQPYRCCRQGDKRNCRTRSGVCVERVSGAHALIRRDALEPCARDSERAGT
jgi:hypothetical protein